MADVLAMFQAVLYRPSMFDTCPFEPVQWHEVEATLAAAIRSSGGGQMTGGAEVFLAGVCAQHLVDKLVLAGYLVVRRPEDRMGSRAE